MKKIIIFVSIYLFFSAAVFCVVGQLNSSLSSANEKKESLSKIQELMRQVLKQADSGNRIELWASLINRGNVYVGFDLDKHKTILYKLRATGLYAEEFVENFNQIVLFYDKMLRDGELEWFTGELIPLANGANPWCKCQDVPYDEPCPWENIEVEITKLTNTTAEAVWRWGLLRSDSPWNEFPYHFRAVKENGKWKISYLEGFDLFHKDIIQNAEKLNQ